MRNYSKLDQARAQICVDEIWRWRDTEGSVSYAFLARKVDRWGRSTRDKVAGIRYVQGLMPLVQELLNGEHRGYCLQFPGDQTVRVTNKPIEQRRQSRPRWRKVLTAAERVHSEYNVTRVNSIEPIEQEEAAEIKAAVEALRRVEVRESEKLARGRNRKVHPAEIRAQVG